MCTLFFWDFCFCILDITKVKIGSYSRHVTGNGFVIESKMVDLLAALLGVMTVSAVFFCYLYPLLSFIFVFGGQRWQLQGIKQSLFHQGMPMVKITALDNLKLYG